MLPTFRRYVLPEPSESKCVYAFRFETRRGKEGEVRMGTGTSSRSLRTVDREGYTDALEYIKNSIGKLRSRAVTRPCIHISFRWDFYALLGP
jgi:hypothetical protein